MMSTPLHTFSHSTVESSFCGATYIHPTMASASAIAVSTPPKDDQEAYIATLLSKINRLEQELARANEFLEHSNCVQCEWNLVEIGTEIEQTIETCLCGNYICRSCYSDYLWKHCKMPDNAGCMYCGVYARDFKCGRSLCRFKVVEYCSLQSDTVRSFRRSQDRKYICQGCLTNRLNMSSGEDEAEEEVTAVAAEDM